MPFSYTQFAHRAVTGGRPPHDSVVPSARVRLYEVNVIDLDQNLGRTGLSQVRIPLAPLTSGLFAAAPPSVPT